MFDFKYFFSILPKNSLILDYGCGRVPIWNCKLPSKIKKIYLYDREKNIIPPPPQKKIAICNKGDFCFDVGQNKKRTVPLKTSGNGVKFKKNYMNVVLFNSVLQYFQSNQFKIFTNFYKNKNIKLIIISDIPLYNRFLETLIILFLNPSRLLSALKYQSNFNYFKYKFYLRSQTKILNLIKCNHNVEEYFTIKKLKKNLYGSNFTRYTLLFKRK